MKALSTAIYSKKTGSTFDTDIGGRLFKGQAEEGTDFPYAVFIIVSDVPDNAFNRKGEDVLIQFSLFSAASGTGEIEDMFSHLKTLYDECSLTITGHSLVWMRRVNATLFPDEITTPQGTQRVWHYAVDYQILTEES